MINYKYNMLISLTFLAFFSACTGPKLPPHFGFFYKDGAQFQELTERRGGPDTFETEGIPFIENIQPQIVVWTQSVNFDLLSLRDDYGDGDRIDYTISLGEEDYLYYLTPREQLTADVYCFIQGDFLAIPGSLSHWCFHVGSEDSQSTSDSSNKIFSEQELKEFFVWHTDIRNTGINEQICEGYEKKTEWLLAAECWRLLNEHHVGYEFAYHASLNYLQAEMSRTALWWAISSESLVENNEDKANLAFLQGQIYSSLNDVSSMCQKYQQALTTAGDLNAAWANNIRNKISSQADCSIE